MNRKETKPVAEPIAKLQRELEEHRRLQPRRAKLPESIWEAATALARQHGLYAVTQALRLDYMGLKKLARDLHAALAQVQQGVEIVIEQDHRPVAVLEPFASTRPGRKRSECIVPARADEAKLGHAPVADEDFS